MVEARHERRLAAIVFTDIVNFSATVHRDEVLGQRLLNRQRAVIQRLTSAHGGRQINTAGDSCLLEFPSALAAVRTAVMIQQTLASDATQQPGEPPLMLRVSVHLCDVEHCETGAYGDGINVAARLLPYSPEGGLCLSAGIRALVRQRLNLPLRPIGTPALKNIEEPVEAFVLHADELLAVQLAGELPTPRRRLSGLRLGAIAAGLGVVVVLWALGLIETPSAQAPGVEPMPSLAVLPFDNRSPDPADAFFAEGVQDEILTRLARVGSIKVVSRSSTRGYGAQPSDLRRVGRELGVNHLLLGSVQRAGDRVRINVHLVDAQSRATRWAELYDRGLADVLSVQTEVASAVVTALDTRLARADQVALARVPTTDSGAYDAYLRGRYYQNRAETTPANFNGAAQHFEDAVRLDPSFALAWAQLSYMHSQIHWFGFDATPARLAQAENAAATAARLQPELGEAFLARGYVRYWGYQDYDGALALFAEAERRLPNDAEVPMAQSYVYRRRGDWERTLALQARALDHDPRNPAALHQYAVTLMFLPGRLAEAQAVTERGLNLLPDDPDLRSAKLAVLHAQGKLDAARQVLAERPPQPSDHNLFLAQLSQWLYERQPEKVVAAARPALAAPDPGVGAGIGAFYVLLALAEERSGNAKAGQQTCREGIATLQRLRADGFSTARVALDLAQLHAGLGQADAARAELDLADGLLAQDRLDGPAAREVRAKVEARLGQTEAALALIDPLLSTTYSSFDYGTPLTAALLQQDPVWDSLRGNARFASLSGQRPILTRLDPAVGFTRP